MIAEEVPGGFLGRIELDGIVSLGNIKIHDSPVGLVRSCDSGGVKVTPILTDYTVPLRFDIVSLRFRGSDVTRISTREGSKGEGRGMGYEMDTMKHACIGAPTMWDRGAGAPTMRVV